MKSQEDPRINPDINCEFYNSEEDDSCYDSEGSSSESSSREQEQYKTTAESNINERAQVLVAAGCKSCLMYFMVPKQAEDCPKCYGQLLHFDRSENSSPWSNHYYYYYFWIIFPLFFFFLFDKFWLENTTMNLFQVVFSTRDGKINWICCWFVIGWILINFYAFSFSLFPLLDSKIWKIA